MGTSTYLVLRPPCGPNPLAYPHHGRGRGWSCFVLVLHLTRCVDTPRSPQPFRLATLKYSIHHKQHFGAHLRCSPFSVAVQLSTIVLSLLCRSSLFSLWDFANGHCHWKSCKKISRDLDAQTSHHNRSPSIGPHPLVTPSDTSWNLALGILSEALSPCRPPSLQKGGHWKWTPQVYPFTPKICSGRCYVSSGMAYVSSFFGCTTSVPMPSDPRFASRHPSFAAEPSTRHRWSLMHVRCDRSPGKCLVGILSIYQMNPNILHLTTWAWIYACK